MVCFQVARQGVAVCCFAPYDDMFAMAAQALESYFSAITGASGFQADASARAMMRKADHGLNGFAYRVEAGDLIIEAANAEAARYAVYDLLERLAGCRFYTSTVERIPADPNLALQVEDYSFSPILQFRELHYRDYADPVFAAKRKMHPCGQHAGWGFWCHSFGQLLPAKEYYDEHPEYYALIDGKRNPMGQPCLTNPDVLEIMAARMGEFIAAQPDKRYWSVSQDDHDRYCRCPAC